MPIKHPLASVPGTKEARTMKPYVTPESEIDPSKPQKVVVKRYQPGKAKPKAHVSANNLKPVIGHDQSPRPKIVAGKVVPPGWKSVPAAEWDHSAKRVGIRYHWVRETQHEEVDDWDDAKFPGTISSSSSTSIPSTSGSDSSFTTSSANTDLATIEEEESDQEDLVAKPTTTLDTNHDNLPVYKEPVQKHSANEELVPNGMVHENSTHEAAPIHKGRTSKATSPADQYMEDTNDSSNSISTEDSTSTHSTLDTSTDGNEKQPDQVPSPSISAFELMAQHHDLNAESFTSEQWDEVMKYQWKYLKNQKRGKMGPSMLDCREVFATVHFRGERK
ncbi:hypothetical protein B0T20DRAFT_481650 [Sordaria brevicollis]|uniref:Uncharacterized protein n=1 Tax=Sordaria brevicollis TaxID=83679 RepID=A0AAE0PBC4_SORBR|nr:hypothetical protein B0T20DRAFT_481650 [Sordaria brevicollis]